jgi:hypothetical protein
VAELCFVAQWAIILHQLGRMTGAETAVNIALVIVPIIIIAECFSWYAVVTTNFLFNAVENSLWAVTFFLAGLALCRLVPEFQGPVRWALIAGIIGIACFLAFLVTVDVPMYLSRWRAGHQEGSKFLGFLEGLHDVSTRWVVTHDIAHWKGELTWMFLYFSVAVWSSLALCALYAMEGYLTRYLA